MQYSTSGQVARKLRVSISTLKRWTSDPDIPLSDLRNQSGWRLFSDIDIERLRMHKRELRKAGRRFNETTLIPIVISAQRVAS